MRKETNKTAYGVLAGVGFTVTLLFFGEIGMRYENIGSYTGAALGILILLYGVGGLKYERLTKTGRLLFSLAKPLGLAVGAVLLLTFGFMIFGIPHTRMEEDATMIILGCGVNSDGSPSAIMQGRVDAAVNCLSDHPDMKIIVSGGQLGGAPISEAESMKQALIAAGIDENRIFCEGNSRTTAENLRFSKELIEAEGLSTNAALVTSEFHLARACLYAKRNGLTPSPVLAATPWYCLPAYVLREVYAVFDAFFLHRI